MNRNSKGTAEVVSAPKPRADEATAAQATAGEVLIRYILNVGHWGIAIASVGFAFAVTAVASRFDSPVDIAAPEFIACLAFAAVICVVGGVMHIAELKYRWVDPYEEHHADT